MERRQLPTRRDEVRLGNDGVALVDSLTSFPRQLHRHGARDARAVKVPYCVRSANGPRELIGQISHELAPRS